MCGPVRRDFYRELAAPVREAGRSSLSAGGFGSRSQGAELRGEQWWSHDGRDNTHLHTSESQVMSLLID